MDLNEKISDVTIFSGGENYAGIDYCSANFLSNLFLKTNTSTEYISAHELNSLENIKSKAFVFPGGTCSAWESLLTEETQKNLLRYIYEGGKVLGVCAGSYFQCKKSRFTYFPLNTNTPQTLKKKRILSIFPGKGIGPLIQKDPNRSSPLNCKAKQIEWIPTGEKGFVYVNGGGYFVPENQAESGKDYLPLAKYKDGKLAIVACSYGKGHTVLSFPHFEFTPMNVESYCMQKEEQQHLQHAFQKLKENGNEEFIEKLRGYILKELWGSKK